MNAADIAVQGFAAPQPLCVATQGFICAGNVIYGGPQPGARRRRFEADEELIAMMFTVTFNG